MQRCVRPGPDALKTAGPRRGRRGLGGARRRHRHPDIRRCPTDRRPGRDEPRFRVPRVAHAASEMPCVNPLVSSRLGHGPAGGTEILMQGWSVRA